MRFSSIEIKDLLIAGFIISLAFAILLSGGYRALSDLETGLLIIFSIAFFTAGLGFLLHELMHKFVAQGYGLWAEFRAYYPGLWMALIFSFFGFILAAPGAVFIHGLINKERNGRISLAGPVTNIVLAIIFLFLVLFNRGNGVLNLFFTYGLSINALLAAFNMIPVLPFDGAKIIAWDKRIYFLTLAIALGLWLGSWILP